MTESPNRYAQTTAFGTKASGQCSRCHRALRDPVSVRRGMGPVCWANSMGDAFERDLEASDEEWARREKLLRADGEIDLGHNWEYDQGQDFLPWMVRVSLRFNSVTARFEAYGSLVNPGRPSLHEAEIIFGASADLKTAYAAAVKAGPNCAAGAAWRRKELARRFRSRRVA